MAIKLGDISPLAGSITGKGIFGDIQKALGPMASLLYQATQAKRDSDTDKESDKNFLKSNKFNSAGSYKKGGKVKTKAKTKKMAAGGKVTRGDGIAKKGHTKGKMV